MAREDRLSGAIDRRILMLQGPPGPMFRLLASRLRAEGAQVERVVINGGDEYDWGSPAIAFKGSAADWPTFIESVMVDHRITDVLLFGDCRPHHVVARGLAQRLGLAVHVLEEGYIRPNWMTFERDGVNYNSKLPRDPEWFLRVARTLPAPSLDAPIRASFNRRARDGFWYYAHVWLRAWRYPRYRNHRPVRIWHEFAGWAWRLLWQKRWERRAHAVSTALQDMPYFLFPLQLTSDYQIRQHSLFPDMQSATNYVLASFARAAPADAHLLLKIHPLDVSMVPWRRHINNWARKLGLADRVHVVDGGSLEALIEASRGMVCVNSTSATLALSCGKPVAAIGDAVYNMPKLTHQASLDSFWRAPIAPSREVFEAFRAVLVDRYLVRGGIASASAVAALIDAIVDRLLREWENLELVSRETHRPG